MARYTVIDGSESRHCCFEATVMDREKDDIVCECFERAEAELIAEALNAFSVSTPPANHRQP